MNGQVAIRRSALPPWCFTARLRCSAPVSDRAAPLTGRSFSGSIDLRSNQRAGSETHAQLQTLRPVTLSSDRSRESISDISKGLFSGRQRFAIRRQTACRSFVVIRMIIIGCLLLTRPVFGGNLLPNGDFEQADPVDSRRPLGWDLPDGLGLQWVQSDHGKAIRMDTQLSEIRMNEQWTKLGLTNTWFVPKAAATPIAETYGLSFYSAAIPVKTGQAYRVSFDYKGAPGGGKVWVRCFGQQAGESRRLYEKIVFCEKKGTDWVHYQEFFFPTKYRPAVTEMRVMLYAYYPAGIYWFANIEIEPIRIADYENAKRAVEQQ